MSGDEDGDDVGAGAFADLPEGWTTRRKQFRGISQRLARHYLSNLGGDVESDDLVVGDDWRVALDSEKVNVAGSVTLTEVTVDFAGDPAALETLVEKFSQKAMRAGG